VLANKSTQLLSVDRHRERANKGWEERMLNILCFTFLLTNTCGWSSLPSIRHYLFGVFESLYIMFCFSETFDFVCE
jgi:hypothetical protein